MYAGSGISTRTGGRPINWCGHENGYVPRAETLAGWFRLVPVGPGRPFVSIEPLESVLQKNPNSARLPRKPDERAPSAAAPTLLNEGVKRV
jgi:hypothetical protein